tara:strand:- start:1865 stop:3310 length:1446 start_codon:yes stop_codon:yes gene_type:complete
MQKSTLDTDFSYRLFGSEKSKLIDNKVCEAFAKPFVLMLRAAEAAKKLLVKENAGSVTIFIGKGNNGEDGLCLAALLKIENIKTHVIDLDYKNRPETYSYRLCLNLGINTEKYITKKIPKADWYVDAIFGIGLNRNLTGNYLKAVNYLKCSKSKKILSLDMPSGLHGSKGNIFKKTVQATITISFLTLKPGLFFDDASDYVGDIYFDDLRISKTFYNPDMTSISRDKTHFPILSRSAHKGSRGSLICLGGSKSMEGAGILACISALRSGAGKVFWASDTDKLQRPPELIQIEPCINEIQSVLDKNMRIAIIGPGLGKRFDKEIEFLWNTDLNIILDADGLDWLSRKKPKKRSAPWVGTPHKGEVKKLLENNMSDKWSNLIKLKKIYGGDWILKGPGTLVSEEKKLWINLYSNGWLGTAGMGDVLAGIIAGLWSSGSRTPFRSAVYLQTQCAKHFLSQEGAGLTAGKLSELIGFNIGLIHKA